MAKWSVERGQTRDFIAEAPTEISIQRDTLSPDGAGGFGKVTSTLDPQTVRIIERNTAASVLRTTVDGREVTPDFVIIAEYDADIRTDDAFFLDGIKYEIVYVRMRRDYETWAEVNYRG